MKKMMITALVLCLGVSAFALGDPDKKVKAKDTVMVTGIVTDTACAKSGDKAKMTNESCAKRCSERDGGKLSFVSDKDGSIWAIENVDAVKGQEGKHVKLMGKPNMEAKSFYVNSFSTDTGEKSKGKVESIGVKQKT